ncbi:MAG: hypothetical protein LBL69_04495 [Zoogloeaceae bacterium]|jgi:hypothetical protein|nr:hypothetical protein [Zoogloeaceae bacterium]
MITSIMIDEPEVGQPLHVWQRWMADLRKLEAQGEDVASEIRVAEKVIAATRQWEEEAAQAEPELLAA